MIAPLFIKNSSRGLCSWWFPHPCRTGESLTGKDIQQPPQWHRSPWACVFSDSWERSCTRLGPDWCKSSSSHTGTWSHITRLCIDWPLSPLFCHHLPQATSKSSKIIQFRKCFNLNLENFIFFWFGRQRSHKWCEYYGGCVYSNLSSCPHDLLPVQSKTITNHFNYPYHNDEIRVTKECRHKLKRQWRKSR